MKIVFALGLLALLWGTAWDLQQLQNPENKRYMLVIEAQESPETAETDIRLLTEQGVITLPMSDYLTGVILTEMPASFEVEALKAQAVAARTFALRTMARGKHADGDVCTNSGCCQAWRSESELRQAFGEKYEEYAQKGRLAVKETEEQVMFYGDEIIDAVYFSCSGGSSEDSMAVWGTDVPYLRAVGSPGEENSSKFSSRVAVPFEEFCDIVREENPDAKFSVIPQDWIGTVRYTAGGGVKDMEIGGITIAGTRIRSLFKLASTKFQVSIGDGAVEFAVQGYGHRVGMSQYGAEAMAVAGADYRQILTHYYSGITIKKLSRP